MKVAYENILHCLLRTPILANHHKVIIFINGSEK